MHWSPMKLSRPAADAEERGATARAACVPVREAGPRPPGPVCATRSQGPMAWGCPDASQPCSPRLPRTRDAGTPAAALGASPGGGAEARHPTARGGGGRGRCAPVRETSRGLFHGRRAARRRVLPRQESSRLQPDAHLLPPVVLIKASLALRRPASARSLIPNYIHSHQQMQIFVKT